jgi:hypothetical protein
MKKILKILTAIALIAPVFAGLTVLFTAALLASIIQFIFPKVKMLSKLIEFLEDAQKLIEDFVGKNKIK